jgi:hypothetical protein
MLFLHLPEFEPLAVQPAVIHYTDYNAYTFLNSTLDREELPNLHSGHFKPVEMKKSSNHHIRVYRPI